MSKKQLSDSLTRYPHSIKRGMTAVPILMLLLFIVALAESKSWLQQGREALYIFAALFVAAFTAGIVGARGIKHKRIGHCLCAQLGLVVFLILLGLFTKESNFFNMLLLWSIITVLCGAFMSVILSSGRSGKGRRRRKYNK